MEYNILALGDVASETGLQLLEKKLRAFKKEHHVRFTVVNGENISGSGLTRPQAEALFAAGADVVTLGNHTFGKPQIATYLDEERYILRPANFTGRAPGHGYQLIDCGAFTVAVLVLIGRCDLDFNAENPFTTADKLLRAQTDKPTFTLVEFHAGATSEKLALAYYLDGRVSALWGTHTHVPTADMQVFPKGTGYVTDLGMTGPRDSVLGIRPDLSIAKFRGDLTERYRWADGPTKMEAALFTIDSATGLCRKAGRVDEWD